MGNQLLASKIVSNEASPKIRNFPRLATAVLSVQGIAQRGPVGVPALCLSWEDFTRVFGGFITDGDLATVVYGIYIGDAGARVWVSRLVHYTDPATPATKTSVAATADILGTTVVASGGAVTSGNIGPFNLEPNQTLQLKEDGGGPVAVAFPATQAVKAGSGFSFASLDGLTLEIAINSGETQLITFSSTPTDLASTIIELNSFLRFANAYANTGEIDIRSDLRGSDSKVDIIGGTALTILGHAVGASAGTGDDVANIDAVTFAETKALVEAALATVLVTEETTGEITITTVGTGASKSIQVDATSTAIGFGFDNLVHSGSDTGQSTVIEVSGKDDGVYAHDLRIAIDPPSNGQADYFNWITTDDDGVILESFLNVQNTDDAANDFVDTVLNDEDAGSLYFATVDVGLAIAPDTGTIYTPSGGNDGIVGIADSDWLGDSGGKTGLHAFNTKSDITLLLDGDRATMGWHLGMITYCEITRSGKIFPLLDPPEGYTYTQMVTYVRVTAALKNLSEYGAIFWPRPKIVNPNTDVFGSSKHIVVSASGIMGGVISRNDNETPGGIYKAPAGIEEGRLFGVTGFDDENVIDEEVRDYIYPERINPLTVMEGFPRHNDGNWTLKENGQFPTISERRGVIHIKRSIENGLQFARHKNHDAELRNSAHLSTDNFLKEQMKLSAFRTKDPATAYFVDFTEAINTPAVVNAYKLKGRVGLATQKSTEWVILEFSQDTRRLEEELAG